MSVAAARIVIWRALRLDDDHAVGTLQVKIALDAQGSRRSAVFDRLRATVPGDVLRKAGLDDVPRLEALIAASVRGLQAGDYSVEQMERALGQVFGVDRRLIEDGVYYVVERAGDLVACGGWSYRGTLFGADAIHGRDDTELAPGVDAARIRAFFVSPSCARQGLATRLLETCEAAAAERGFAACELGATLTGVAFYARHGYRALEEVVAPLGAGLGLPILRMHKILASPA